LFFSWNCVFDISEIDNIFYIVLIGFSYFSIEIQLYVEFLLLFEVSMWLMQWWRFVENKKLIFVGIYCINVLS